MNMLQGELYAAGFVVSPNNIHSLPGVIMYPGGNGVFPFLRAFDVQVTNDRIRVFSCKFFGEAHSRRSYWDTVTEAVFDTVPLFLTWCEYMEDNVPSAAR